MKFSLIFISLCVCLTVSKPTRDDSLDAYLREILELLKGLMTIGLPDLGIPVLDPFDIGSIEIDHIEEDIIKADITIDELVITNLATFGIEVVHMDLESLGLDLELTIANLRGDAIYSMDGSIAGILPLYGDGPMWLEIHGLDLIAAASIMINEEGFVEIVDMNLDAKFTEIKIHLDNLLGGGNFGETINNMLNLLGGFIWDQLKGILIPELNKVLKEFINDALHGCNIADLIQNGECLKRRLAEIQGKIGHIESA